MILKEYGTSFNDSFVVTASAVTGKLNVVVDKLTVEEYGHCCKLCNASVLVQLCRAYEYVVCLPLTGCLTSIYKRSRDTVDSTAVVESSLTLFAVRIKDRCLLSTVPLYRAYRGD